MALQTTTDRGNQHRFDRGSWLAIGVVLLIAGASIALTVAILIQVGDGCVYDAGAAEGALFGACVGGWPTPLRVGDELLAVNGVTRPDGIILAQPPSGWVEGGIVRYTVRRAEQTLDLDVPLRRMGWDGILRAFGYGLAQQAQEWNTFALISAIVIFALAPRARAAQLLLVAIGGLTAVTALLWPGASAGADYSSKPIWLVGVFLSLVWVWLFVPTVLLLVLSFPRRVWPLARWPRRTVALIYGLPLTAVVASLITTNGTFYLAALGIGALCVIVATIGITTYTFLRVHDPVVHAQTLWLTLGLALGLAFWPLTSLLFEVYPTLIDLERQPWWLALPLNAIPILAFPLCLGIAITRYRLFDIDIVINRTLVYGTLTLCVVGGYALLVALLGQLFQAQDSFLVSLAGTGVVALVFQPLRERIQRAVNRVMYGRRDEPYHALAQLGQRLDTSFGPEAVLTVIVETIAATLKLPAVAIAIGQGDDERVAASVGELPHAAHQITIPLSYQGETVGRLLLAPRRGERALSRTDRTLLDDLARQAGIAVHAVRLSSDLQHSRERLVTAREEERRRLRRDLHDGLGPTLASIAQRIEVAAVLVEADPARSTALLHDLEGQVRGTIGDIRRLVYDLRPPTLDQHGLAGAIRIEVARWREGPLQIGVEATEPLPPLPAAVEVAAYRIVQEAVTNVVRHAQAQRCTIGLHMPPDSAWLEVEVVDDGRGLPAEYRAGVGLNAMRERVEELGGMWRIEPNGTRGTRVCARLPLPQEGV
jgi:signal transduction histidine kinase